MLNVFLNIHSPIYNVSTMAARHFFFALTILLKLLALIHLIAVHNEIIRSTNKKGLLYFEVKTRLCDIEADGNGFLWCFCHDKITRRHIGLSWRKTFISSLAPRNTTTLLMTLLLVQEMYPQIPDLFVHSVGRVLRLYEKIKVLPYAVSVKESSI